MTINDGIRFFREVRFELSKVVWPKYDEWLGSTLIVLFLVFVFAVYLFCVDQVVLAGVNFLLKVFGG